jgi:hypothetical protein
MVITYQPLAFIFHFTRSHILKSGSGRVWSVWKSAIAIVGFRLFEEGIHHPDQLIFRP